jgi:cytidylate kinase
MTQTESREAFKEYCHTYYRSLQNPFSDTSEPLDPGDLDADTEVFDSILAIGPSAEQFRALESRFYSAFRRYVTETRTDIGSLANTIDRLNVYTEASHAQRAMRQLKKRRRYKIWLILGRSGVGKSQFAKYLWRQLKWLYLEIDQFPRGDGIDIHNLRKPWDMFYKFANTDALAKELRERAKQARTSGCVLSFPSSLVLSPRHIDAAKTCSMKVVYLYGAAADCITAFLKREGRSGRNLGIDHWFVNNTQSYMTISRPEFARHRFLVFDATGRRHQPSEILQDIKRR